MKTHVLRGSKHEIAERLVQLCGDVREAIVFEDEPASSLMPPVDSSADIFAEMHAIMVDVPGLV